MNLELMNKENKVLLLWINVTVRLSERDGIRRSNIIKCLALPYRRDKSLLIEIFSPQRSLGATRTGFSRLTFGTYYLLRSEPE
jgi:hypothetical protein